MSATFDAQFLNIPIRALSVNGVVLPIVTREATITRSANRHDTVEMSVLIAGTVTFDGKVRVPIDQNLASAGTTDISPETLSRQPVSFVYGVSPQTEQFVGYVTAVTPDQTFKQGLNLKLTLTGTSVVLQRVIRRFETNLTVPEAIAGRVNAQRLGFLGDEHPYVWDALAQTKETDWQAIVSLAASVGFVVFTHSAVVRAVSPLPLFKQFPYTTLTSSDDLLESDRKLMDFKPQEASLDLIDKQGLEINYFDPNGKVGTIRQTLTSPRPRWVPFTETPVADRSRAEVLVKASEETASRWPQHASARIRGDAGIYPGLIVNVDSASSKFQFNGRWLVMKATHSMDRTAFMTELQLARPLKTPLYTNSTFQHFWDQAGLPKPSVFLRDGAWSSSLNKSVVGAS